MDGKGSKCINLIAIKLPCEFEFDALSQSAMTASLLESLIENRSVCSLDDSVGLFFSLVSKYSPELVPLTGSSLIFFTCSSLCDNDEIQM